MSPIFRWSGAKRETKRPILGGDDPAYYLNGQRVGEDPAELCNKVSVEICGDQFRVFMFIYLVNILWSFKVLFTCYMASEHSSSETRACAEGLARDINSNHFGFCFVSKILLITSRGTSCSSLCAKCTWFMTYKTSLFGEQISKIFDLLFHTTVYGAYSSLGTLVITNI